MAWALSKTSRLTHRCSSICSAPNISGTSVIMVLPPLATSISPACPSTGLAVTPDRPSLPPHFIPITSSLAGMGFRLNCPAYSASLTSRRLPSATSSSTSWQTRNLTRSGLKPSPAVRIIASLNSAGTLFSQPRLTTSTAPALGWFTREARSCLVISLSSPSWLHPKGWGKA